MRDDGEPDPWKIKFTPEQYRKIQAAAALRGLSIEDWAILTLENYADELIKIEAYHRRQGLKVLEPDNDELA